MHFFWQYLGLNSGLYPCEAGTNPFCPDYFGNMVSYFAHATLDHGPPILGFPLLLG
jgi:hypothetical protein